MEPVASKDPFSEQGCCKVSNTEFEQLTANHYSLYGTIFDSYLTKAYSAEVYGKDTERWYDLLNEAHYLYILMTIIYWERYNDKIKDAWLGTGCGNDLGGEYYADKYNIDCIQKRFMCYGVNVDLILENWGLNPDTFTELDGIGYMNIDYEMTDCNEETNTFQINEN